MVVPDMIKDSRDFTPILFVLNIETSSLFNTTRSQVNNILFYIRVLNTRMNFPTVVIPSMAQLPSLFFPDRFPAFQARPLAPSDQELGGLFLAVSMVKGM